MTSGQRRAVVQRWTVIRPRAEPSESVRRSPCASLPQRRRTDGQDAGPPTVRQSRAQTTAQRAGLYANPARGHKIGRALNPAEHSPASPRLPGLPPATPASRIARASGRLQTAVGWLGLAMDPPSQVEPSRAEPCRGWCPLVNWGHVNWRRGVRAEGGRVPTVLRRRRPGSDRAVGAAGRTRCSLTEPTPAWLGLARRRSVTTRVGPVAIDHVAKTTWRFTREHSG